MHSNGNGGAAAGDLPRASAGGAGDKVASDLSGVAKAVWVVALLLFPMLSLLAYLIIRGGSMERRTTARAAEAEADFQSYVRQTAATATPTDEIARARELLDQGVIDAREFEVLKAKALAA